MKKAGKAKLKGVRELIKDKKVRDAEGMFVAEGLKIVRDMIGKGYPLESVVVSRDFADNIENEALLQSISTTVFIAENADFKNVSSLQHSQGILAVVLKSDSSKTPLPGGAGTLLMLCDGIQDPGNLGTIIRVSVAFEADIVLLMGDTADVYNPKVVRASGGTVCDIPIRRCDIGLLDSFKKDGYYLLAGRPQEEESRDIAGINKFQAPVILAFGSEGKGVSGEVAGRADGFFYIPMCEKVESLNVAIAAAISLYVFRNR